MNPHADERVSPLRDDDPPWVGPYRLIGRLGTGGMGTVYLGERDDTRVAVKVVRGDLAADGEFRQRFRSEARRAQQVPPFCTAQVIHADPEHDPPYLVVEYVDGPSLSAVVSERGPLSPANLHGVAIGVATALAAIHGAGVVHRDLKPANVLLAPGSPKVIDFGIAQALEVTSQLTRPGIVLGSVSYMAPERIEPDPGVPIGPAVDIFAWGAVIVYAGTGRLPFEGDSPTATAVQITSRPPELYDLAQPLRGLVEACLAKDPRARPTARELLDLLLAGAPGANRVDTAPQGRTQLREATLQVQQGPRKAPPAAVAPAAGGRRWSMRRVTAVLIAIAAVAALAVVLGLTVFTHRPERTIDTATPRDTPAAGFSPSAAAFAGTSAIPGPATPSRPPTSATAGRRPASSPSPATTQAAVSGRAIIGHGSMKCLRAKPSDGSPVHLWTCDGSVAEKWVLMGDRTIRSGGLCMDAAGAGTVNGTIVQVARCSGVLAQQFTVTSADEIVGLQSGLCLDAKDAGTANGTAIQLWDCWGDGNQTWTYA